MKLRMAGGHKQDRNAPVGDRYKWVALSNTTLGVLIASVDGSIVIISLPAIFRGIGLDPLAPGNIGYLLWMILGYLLVSAVLVVALGRLGDMFGRVRMYNMGFAIFAFASLALSLDPFTGGSGRAVADRLAHRAGLRRLHADRQLRRHPHRRVPRPSSAAWRWASTRSPRSPASSSACSPAACSPSSTGARCSGSASRSA